MSPQTFFTLIVMAIGFMAWYSNTSLKNRILCTFRRINKTKINKFVAMKNRYVIFDGGKYDIIPSRITFLWYQTGLVHMLFPQWVATLDYSWNSRFPHDPNHLEYNSETPQVRKALNKEEWVESYYKGARPAQSGKKQSQIMQYLPWLAIGLVALVAFWSYNNMQAFAAHLNAIQNSLNAITK